MLSKLRRFESLSFSCDSAFLLRGLVMGAEGAAVSTPAGRGPEAEETTAGGLGKPVAMLSMASRIAGARPRALLGGWTCKGSIV